MDENELEGLSPEELKQIIQLGVLPQQGDQLKAQLAQASSLRNNAIGNMGQPITNGRVVTAPTAVGTLGNLGLAIAGQHQADKIQGQYKDIADQQTTGRNSFLAALLRKKKQPVSMDPMSVDEANVPMPTGNYS